MIKINRGPGTTCLALICLLCSGIAPAELAANVGIASDYIYRGISQTNRNPALQGGLDYSHESGLYAGDSPYLETSLVVPLDKELTLDMRIGRQEYSDNAIQGLPDFTYRTIALIWQAAEWETRLSWHDTGVASSNCFGGRTWCDSALTQQLSRKFVFGGGK